MPRPFGCEMDPDKKLWRIIEKTIFDESGCWLYNGVTNHSGYGTIGTRVNGNTKYVHRWFYLKYVQDIPDCLELDHLCHIRNCWNPGHLDPVTQQENIYRAKRRLNGRRSYN
jgi:hypothetical protein